MISARAGFALRVQSRVTSWIWSKRIGFGTETFEKSETQSRCGCCGVERNHYLCLKATHKTFDGIQHQWTNAPELSSFVYSWWRLCKRDGSLEFLAIGRTIEARSSAAARTYLFSNTSRPASFLVGSNQWVPRTLSWENWRKRGSYHPNERISVVRVLWSGTSIWCLARIHFYLYGYEPIVHIYVEYNILSESGSSVRVAMKLRARSLGNRSSIPGSARDFSVLCVVSFGCGSNPVS
jgi:hypothetical protein